MPTAPPPPNPDGPAARPTDIGNAPLSNMLLCYNTMLNLMESGASSPRIGLFYGFSGYGKTTAAAFTAARFDHLYIQALPCWTAKGFVRALAADLGIIRPARETSNMLEQIFELLRRQPRALIIDEFDYLLKDRFIELVRSIHDNTPTPILLIGEEKLPAALKDWDRFDNRILIATPAQAASDDDALLLRDNYCRHIRVADDLALYFAERARRVTRRIATNLIAAQRIAATEGVESIDRAWWGDRPVMTGDVPVRNTLGRL